MKPRTRHIAITLVLVALLCMAIATARAVQGKGASDPAAPGGAGAPPTAVPVATARAARERVPVVAAGIGTVAALKSVLVTARIDGQLQEVAFQEGQEVRAGQPLARIDARALQAQLAQYEAQKARDEAQLANARVDLDRYEQLIRTDAIPRQQLDAQRAQVRQLQATARFDQAQVDNARVQLDYAVIRAPIDGRTGRRLVDPGNIVRATDTTGIVAINQIDPISVLFTLPEDRLRDVLAAQKAGGPPPVVQALGRGNGALLATGRLTLVNNQIDTATGTFQLRAVFPNASQALWPGQYVDIRVVLRELPDAVTIPDAAVQRGPDGQFAWVVRPDGSAAAQPLVLTQSADGKAVVARGLAPGDRVVVEGQDRLHAGVPVAEAPAH
jgi:multidrug efflux system membrane fusion protein